MEAVEDLGCSKYSLKIHQGGDKNGAFYSLGMNKVMIMAITFSCGNIIKKNEKNLLQDSAKVRVGAVVSLKFDIKTLATDIHTIFSYEWKLAVSCQNCGPK